MSATSHKFFFFIKILNLRLTASQERLKSASLQNLNAQRKVKQTKVVREKDRALDLDYLGRALELDKLLISFRFHDQELSFTTFLKAHLTRSLTERTLQFVDRLLPVSQSRHQDLRNHRNLSVQFLQLCLDNHEKNFLTKKLIAIMLIAMHKSRCHISRKEKTLNPTHCRT